MQEDFFLNILRHIFRQAEKTLMPVQKKTACSSCTSFFGELFPEIKIVSLYEIIKEEGFNPTVPPFEDAAVFSPCSALHNVALQKSVDSI